MIFFYCKTAKSTELFRQKDNKEEKIKKRATSIGIILECQKIKKKEKKKKTSLTDGHSYMKSRNI